VHKVVLILAIALIAACNHSPTAPDEASLPHGRVAGLVTIGPNCPVESATQPCPTPPSAYAARKILVFSKGRAALLFTVDIDSRGLYSIDLLPNDYVVDIKAVGIDRSADVPANVTIKANNVTPLDIRIDTGLR
jgi:hypothetical protein